LKNLALRLQALLIELSDGEWEHGAGITIENIDNPGWSIRLALTGTPLSELKVDEVFHDRSDFDWIHARVASRAPDKILEITCGPNNLEEAFTLFFQLLAPHLGVLQDLD